KVGALLPPQRAFSRAVVAAYAVGKLSDRLGCANDLVKFRRELFDSFPALCGRATAEAGAEGKAAGRRRCKHVSARQAKSHDDPPCYRRHYSRECVAVSGLPAGVRPPLRLDAPSREHMLSILQLVLSLRARTSRNR